MRLVADDGFFDAQTLRVAGSAFYGGADLGECLATARRITAADLDSWYSEWSATADRVYAAAAASVDVGHRVSAREGFLRASSYYRTAGQVLSGLHLSDRHGLPADHPARHARPPYSRRDLRFAESLHRQSEAFLRALPLLEHPGRVIEIPLEDTSMPGYFFESAPTAAAKPTVILTGGYDCTAEELYFTDGVAALRRGYNVVSFDGPGQGRMLADQGSTFRPDWERVLAPVIDLCGRMPEVDATRIAVIGGGLGGYLAARAASAEHRLAACVVDCGPFDLLTLLTASLGESEAFELPDGAPAGVNKVRAEMLAVMEHPTQGWGFRRAMAAHGVSDPIEYFRELQEFTLAGRAELIRCPLFVGCAEEDPVSMVSALQLARAVSVPIREVTFRSREGAGDHREAAARSQFHQQAFDWLDEALLPARSPVRATVSQD